MREDARAGPAVLASAASSVALDTSSEATPSPAAAAVWAIPSTSPTTELMMSS